MNVIVESMDGGALLVNAEFAEALRAAGLTTAESFWNLRGEAVKKVVRERGTERVELPGADGKPASAYLKRYFPVSWRERLKRWSTLKPAMYDAFNEWGALTAFQRLEIPSIVPMAAGRLAGGRSFSLTLGLEDHVRLSDLFAATAAPPPPVRRRLVAEVADLAARMHAAGFAHQDFYLVHLFVDRELRGPVRIIDLQRAVKWRGGGERWRVKDLAQLLFSARKAGLGIKDTARCWSRYRRPLGIPRGERRLPAKITAKANRIAKHDAKRF